MSEIPRTVLWGELWIKTEKKNWFLEPPVGFKPDIEVTQTAEPSVREMLHKSRGGLGGPSRLWGLTQLGKVFIGVKAKEKWMFPSYVTGSYINKPLAVCNITGLTGDLQIITKTPI